MAVTIAAGASAGGGVPAPAPHFLRRAAAVAALGGLGVLGLLLRPLPSDLLALQPALVAWPTWAVKALLALNPALLVLLAALIGAALAHRVGLRSAVAGTAPWRDAAAVFGRATAIGAVLGLGLAATDGLLRPWLGEAWQRLEAGSAGGAAIAIGNLLYGGVAEEVMLRWGVMSLVAWALARWLGPTRQAATLWLAIAVAAALFAVAHLPVLAAQIELSPAVVGRTLFLNGVAGVLYGWLFWRHHLEAAMTAHAATHLGGWLWRAAA